MDVYFQKRGSENIKITYINTGESGEEIWEN